MSQRDEFINLLVRHPELEDTVHKILTQGDDEVNEEK